MAKYRMISDSWNLYRIEKKTWFGLWCKVSFLFVESDEKPEEAFEKWITNKQFVVYGETNE